MNLIEINNLKFAYTTEYVLKDISLNVEEGDFLAIVGENGSGKSTLLKLILGSLKKDGGSIKLLGKDIEDFNAFERLGYVPQVNDLTKISFPVTCKEYVVMNLFKEFNFLNRPGPKQWEKVDIAFKTLGISKLENLIFKDLSGGQKQKVMIARAIVANPDILILDEPTVGIDLTSKTEFLRLLYHLNTHHKKTIVIITHEMNIVKDYVNKIVKIENGRIIC
ncbi:MAG: metal ABC transporter ATP-binding protein [Peptoniphilaceae bacterium]|nr:metal ABC transporter ATP-binding protein [Peptoniphilaceae bacterium]MDY6019240.1 metal ABC transporter ATP-binding protein [Anaerococcus sp.]